MRSATILALIALTAFAACAKKEPEVINPAPVQPEPVYQGKFGAN